MPVRIRLARHGQRHNPFYHIVAINSSKRRDARPLEKLGTYDPIPRLPSLADLPSSSKVFGAPVEDVPKEKEIRWDVERIRYWLGIGAEPTRSMVKLMERAGVLTVPHKWQHQWSPGLAEAIANGKTRSTPTPSPPSSAGISARSSTRPDTPIIPGSIVSPAGRPTGFAGQTAT